MKTNMNKQEAIERIERNALNIGDNDLVLGLNVAKHIINQINEPQKIAVPQFVADWYEAYKCCFEWNLYNLCIDCHERKLEGDLYQWFKVTTNNPIETLVMMHKFGYEVEKEKLYTAKLKLTGEYLACYPSTKDLHHNKATDAAAKRWELYHFTEDDLVKYHIWENNSYEVNEV